LGVGWCPGRGRGIDWGPVGMHSDPSTRKVSAALPHAPPLKPLSTGEVDPLRSPQRARAKNRLSQSSHESKVKIVGRVTQGTAHASPPGCGGWTPKKTAFFGFAVKEGAAINKSRGGNGRS